MRGLILMLSSTDLFDLKCSDGKVGPTFLPHKDHLDVSTPLHVAVFFGPILRHFLLQINHDTIVFILSHVTLKDK